MGVLKNHKTFKKTLFYSAIVWIAVGTSCAPPSAKDPLPTKSTSQTSTQSGSSSGSIPTQSPNPSQPIITSPAPDNTVPPPNSGSGGDSGSTSGSGSGSAGSSGSGSGSGSSTGTVLQTFTGPQYEFTFGDFYANSAGVRGVDGKEDFIVIKKHGTGSQKTEVEVYNAAVVFAGSVVGRHPTTLDQTGSDYHFAFGKYSSDTNQKYIYVAHYKPNTELWIGVLKLATAQFEWVHPLTLSRSLSIPNVQIVKIGTLDYNQDGYDDLLVLAKFSNAIQVMVFNANDDFKQIAGAFPLVGNIGSAVNLSDYDFAVCDQNIDEKKDIVMFKNSGNAAGITIFDGADLIARTSTSSGPSYPRKLSDETQLLLDSAFSNYKFGCGHMGTVTYSSHPLPMPDILAIQTKNTGVGKVKIHQYRGLMRYYLSRVNNFGLTTDLPEIP
ncbi:MAG: VCBS repeat-containing protein [Deltaproteobacteria bacterium]|nr:VCBS repeat-containing protein [Deltaproteobacteria bacterium]